MRESDSVFRYGSDEFVVILADIRHPQQTKGIAEKLLNAIRAPQHIAGHDLSVTASLGISIYPDDGFDAIALIKKAETAMRNVKESGPNDFSFFIDEMNQRARDQQSIETRHSPGAGTQRICPALPAQTGPGQRPGGRRRGVDPLAKTGARLVYPTDFIGVAEDSGLIVPLSKWVLAEACRQACAWQAAGLPKICMSVNMSAIDFRQRDFVDGIEQILKQTGLEPALLELEITEGVLMQNIDATVTALNRLKALGVRLAIDDFGTGYSSLSYLRRFPIDVLKIDQSFIRGLSSDSNDAALVSAIISLGRSLKLTIIAEGVETLEQLDFLKAHQCEEGQGYYFSKAVEPDAFVRYLGSVQPSSSAAT